MTKKGFTLAEILITLSIIGIIATMTIPSLIQESDGMEHTVAAKKTFSEISTAIKMLEINNELSYLGTALSTHDKLQTSFLTVMDFIKEDEVQYIFEDLSSYKGSSLNWPGARTYPSAIMKNGMFIKFYIDGSNLNCVSGSINACAQITVDTNGAKGPNMHGFDTLNFYIVKKAERIY